VATSIPKEELRNLVASLADCDPSRVLWDGEPVPFLGPDEEGRTGCFVLNVTATRAVGIDEETIEYGVEVDSVLYTRVTYSGVRVRTVQIRAEQYDDEEGFDLLEDVRLGLRSTEASDALRAAGLSLHSLDDIQNIGGSADNRATTFANLDARFNQKVSSVKLFDPDTKTYIEHVELTGQGGMVLAGLVKVDAPTD